MVTYHEHSESLLVPRPSPQNVVENTESSRPASPLSIASTATRVAENSPRTSTCSLPKGTGVQRRAKKTNHTGILRWWPEILSISASIAFFVAIVVVLQYIDGSPQNQWHMPWQIKPSAIISILITVCQMSLTPAVTESIGQLKWVYFEQRPQRLADFMTFDEASRGPWGALCLLWKIRWRAVVASVGAVLVLLALGMGPFTQQVLYPNDITTNIANGTADLGSARFYNSGAQQAYVSVDDAVANPSAASMVSSSGVPTPASSSSLNAMVTPGPQQEPDSSLSSSMSAVGETLSASGIATPSLVPTASFGVYPVAYMPEATQRRRIRREEPDDSKTPCAESRLVRAAFGGLYSLETRMRSSCPSGNCTWPEYTSLGICSQCTDISSSVSTHCSGDAAKGQSCTYDDASTGHVFSAASTCTASSFSGTLWHSFCQQADDGKTSTIAQIDALMLPVDYTRPGDCGIPAPQISSCSLSWCAKTYGNSSSVNGILSDQPTKLTSLSVFDPSTTTCDGLRSLSPPNSNVSWLGLVSSERACPAQAQDVGPDDVFWINKNDHLMIGRMFVDVLDDAYFAPGDHQNTMKISQMAALQAFVDNNAGNLTATMVNITDGMTNYIREASGAMAQGTETTTVVVYQVSWGWLAYPAAVILIGTGFLCAAIVLSREKSKVVWKSSGLAALGHGLCGFDGASALHGRDLRAMQAAAHGARAQLRSDEEGNLKLIRQ